MAQLKDSIVSGNLRVTDEILANLLQIGILRIPTSSGGTTYGLGTDGQIIKSNGSSIYWADDKPNLFYVPRVTKSCNTLPGLNSGIIEEYSIGANYNLPTNNYYHVYSTQGSDIKYGVQLALGMTTTGAYYRAYNNNSWGNWQSLINTWRGIQDNLTSSTNTTESLSAKQGYLLANGSARDNTKVKGLSSGTTSGHIVTWGSDGYTVADSGYTIATSVPANAVFTDTTYTFTNGTNGFTVTPSDGTAQTVTVTPSIANNITGSGTNGKIAKFTGTNTIGNGYGVDTTVTSGSDNLITSGAVYTAIADLPEPMVFKGSLGTGGTITTLPVDGSAKVGDTYKVITDGTYSGQAAKIGDLFICDSKTSSVNTWTYIPSADEPSGTVTSITIKATSPIAIDSSSAITTSGTRTISHANSGVSAGTYRSVTVNATGHVTSGTNPTTLSGYGITDAKISNGTITLGSNTITPLTSHQAETSIRSYLTSTVGHVCKNLLPITLESGTYTDGGANLTYTVDKTAGTITINGTSRTNDNDPITLHIFDDSTGSLNGKFYFSGGSEHCPVRAYDGTTRAWAKAWNGVNNSPYSYSENQSSELAPVSGHETQYRIRIAANQTIVNEVVKPMLRDGNISDDTFEPYVTPTDERIAPMIYSPINHNGIYRGKDLTNVYTIDEIHNRVQNGSFDDLYLGDYFTVSITTDIYTKFTGSSFASGTIYYERTGTLNNWVYTATKDTSYNSSKTYYTKATVTEDVSLMIAHFNYYYNIGDTAFTNPHIILIPRNYGFTTTSKMNPTNTTVGGYYNSEMHQTTLPCYAKSLKTALNNHLLSHKTLLPNVINASTPSMAGAGLTGASSGWDWYDTELQLMTEQQLFGSGIWTSSAYDVGCDGEKLAVFNFVNGVQNGRNSFWLRSVASQVFFARCNSYGSAGNFSASGDYGVRPLIVFG